MAEDEGKDGAQGTTEGKVDDPKEGSGKPDDVVSREDFTRLQSVYDTKLSEKSKVIEGLEGQIATLRSEVDLLKQEAPKDQLERVKVEKDLRAREGTLKVLEKSLADKSLALKARELLAEYKDVGMTVEELVKMGDEATMELAVLRKAAQPKVAGGKLPPKGTIDTGHRSVGKPSSDDEALDRELERAKGK